MSDGGGAHVPVRLGGADAPVRDGVPPPFTASVRTMREYSSVSASSSDPAALVALMNERAAQGWSVVSVAPTGTPAGADVTAFLVRDTNASASVGVAAAAVTITAPSGAQEPAGWAANPEPAPASRPASTGTYGTSYGSTPQSVAPQQPVQQAAPATYASATPAGWYRDPSGRYELRYWDGSQWTEHVARAGNQYTDPPVA